MSETRPPTLSPRPGRGRLVGWSVLVSLLTALSFWAATVELELEPDVFYRWSSALADAAFYVVLLGLVLLLARGFPELLAHRPARRSRASLAVAAAIVAGAFGFDWAYEELFGPFRLEQGIPTFWDGSRAPQFVANLLVVAGLVPYVEEQLFRGVGYGLLERHGRLLAIVTALAFGAAHGHLGLLPAFAVFGAALGWLRAWSGSIWPCVAAHGVFNALVTILSVVLG
ncbi:MAG TPA: CPBP family intramembrane glutamic endopeptidase [Gaiellaceae bacterium]|nr:CPBP family intramembrane glutamic endopeptidase [Gaiellaceae bacterium]